MSEEKAPWFVVERSEALAGLLLTSRDDVDVQSERKKEDGVDFLLSVKEGDSLPTRLFVVQVKGTLSADQNEWMKGVKELFQPKSSNIFVPVCVFLVNVRNNQFRYAWVAEPFVEEQQAILRFPPPAQFRDLDEPAVDEIVNRVKEWYDVLPRQLMPASS
jgi:Domain of unknown function (DUF4365)